MINQEELNNKVKEINKPFKEHNRIIKLSESELRDELILKKQTGFSNLGHYEGEE